MAQRTRKSEEHNSRLQVQDPHIILLYYITIYYYIPYLQQILRNTQLLNHIAF